jgi:hypothetical protein
MNCQFCDKEIPEGQSRKHNGLIVHETCEQFVIAYKNQSYKDTVKCCKEEVYLKPTYLNGYLKGIGRCPKCGLVYTTERFPKDPKPLKIKMPQRPLGGHAQ